jgi:hypothetical protein
MSSNNITTTDTTNKLELKTKDEEKKLFKDDVLDKFNFWIYVGFIILGLLLIISIILLIYSLFSSSTPKVTIDSKPINIKNQEITKPIIPIETKPVVPILKPVVPLETNPVIPVETKPVIPIIKPNVPVETKPSFFSNLFSNTPSQSKPVVNEIKPIVNEIKPIVNEIKPIVNEIKPVVSDNSNESFFSKLFKRTPVNTSTTDNKDSFMTKLLAPLTNRNNIPKPPNNIKGGSRKRIINKYKKYK